MHRLDEVVDTLLVLQKKHRIRFDVWQVVKRDHAIISFFDQGMNPAVPRVAYWTPFRYPLLLNLASLFDNELAEKAWRARLEAHDGRSSSLFSEVCSELLARVHTLGDRRYIELITDALSWAMTHFDELGYNYKSCRSCRIWLDFSSYCAVSVPAWEHQIAKPTSLWTSSHSSTPPSGS